MSSINDAAEVRTIFWDIGGVLLTNGWDVGQRARVLSELGVDVADYESRHDAANFFWERGLSTHHEFFQKTVFRVAGFSEAKPRRFSFEELWERVCAESRMLDPRTFALLARLADSKHYRMATLNNESRELNAFRLDAFDLRRYFDYFICSGYVHEMKPHAGIYRAAIDISGQRAETSLLIDDKVENCDAARVHGMRAIVFESAAQLEEELAAHGVEVREGAKAWN